MSMDWIRDQIKRERKERFLKSPQLSVGEIIDRCEQIKKDNPDMDYNTVKFDFASFTPLSIYSWRGSHDELGLEYGTKSITLDQFIEMMKSVIGKKMIGYKGGEYVMTKETPVWVSEHGDVDYTAIVDVTFEHSYYVIIHTRYINF